jgi:tetratricopeptide (TPR) repeat protein
LPDVQPDTEADLLASLNNLGGLLESTGCYAEAKGLFVDALHVLKQTRPDNDTEIAQALNNLALVCNALGQATEAGPLFTEALRRMKKAPVVNEAHIARCLNNLVRTYDVVLFVRFGAREMCASPS